MYYVSLTPYSPGDIMPAGKYWQDTIVASKLTPNLDPLGEFIREEVRSKYYPDKPSRMRCSMAWLTLADALFFRKHWRPNGFVYEVEFTDPTARQHIVTMTAFEPESEVPIRLQAHEFWNGAMTQESHLEVFAESDLRVLKVLPL